MYRFAIKTGLIRELEKKFNKHHVVLVAQRTMLGKTHKRKGVAIRPYNRTLTDIYQKMLEDICGSTEIVGQRILVRADGTQLYVFYPFSIQKFKLRHGYTIRFCSTVCVFEA